jgi:hypothetical protein
MSTVSDHDLEGELDLDTNIEKTGFFVINLLLLMTSPNEGIGHNIMEPSNQHMTA